MVTLLVEPGDRARVSRGTPGGRPMLPVRQDPEWHLGPCPKPWSPPRDPGHERSLSETPSARPARGVRRPVSCVLARCGRRRRRCWGGKPGRRVPLCAAAQVPWPRDPRSARRSDVNGPRVYLVFQCVLSDKEHGSATRRDKMGEPRVRGGGARGGRWRVPGPGVGRPGVAGAQGSEGAAAPGAGLGLLACQVRPRRPGRWAAARRRLSRGVSRPGPSDGQDDERPGNCAAVIRASAAVLLKSDSPFPSSPHAERAFLSRISPPAAARASLGLSVSRFMFLISLRCWELFFFGREGECCFRFVGWAGVRGSLCVFFFLYCRPVAN